MHLLADNVIAKFHAFIAYKNRRSGNQLADLMLALPTKGTIKQPLTVPEFMFAIAHDYLYAQKASIGKNAASVY
jgi:hypothetical protein